jgi:hypothetical protein
MSNLRNVIAAANLAIPIELVDIIVDYLPPIILESDWDGGFYDGLVTDRNLGEIEIADGIGSALPLSVEWENLGTECTATYSRDGITYKFHPKTRTRLTVGSIGLPRHEWLATNAARMMIVYEIGLLRADVIELRAFKAGRRDIGAPISAEVADMNGIAEVRTADISVVLCNTRLIEPAIISAGFISAMLASIISSRSTMVRIEM